MELKEQLQDHEQRLRKLEESDIRQQIQLANIEKSQSEIKLMINEQSKEQQRIANESNKEQQKNMNDLMQQMIHTLTANLQNDNNTKNNVKFYNTKKFWGVLGALVGILGSIVTFFINK